MKRPLFILAALTLFCLVACKPETGRTAVPEAPKSPASGVLLTEVKGDLVEVSQDFGRSWSVSPLPATLHRPTPGPSGESPWMLAHADGKDAVHRISWDFTKSSWVDEGQVLSGGLEFRIFRIYRNGDQAVLRGGRGESQDRTWASKDEGRSWQVLESEPRFPEVDPKLAEIRASAVKQARRELRSVNVNDADLWQDPGDARHYTAFVFGNSGAALPDSDSRVLFTADAGKTWRVIGVPEGRAVVPIQLSGSGNQAVGHFLSRGGKEDMFTLDFGVSWYSGIREVHVYGLAVWVPSIVQRCP